MVPEINAALAAVVRDAKANTLVATRRGARARARFNMAARVLLAMVDVEEGEHALRQARTEAEIAAADLVLASRRMALGIAEAAAENAILAGLEAPAAQSLTEDERKTLAVAKAPGAVLPFRPVRAAGLRTSDGMVG
jgi:hypothetical protein